MPYFTAVTEEQLAQARQDPAFRRRLLADHLDVLLTALNRLRSSAQAADPDCARQIREGVELAVKLAVLLQAASESVPLQAA